MPLFKCSTALLLWFKECHSNPLLLLSNEHFSFLKMYFLSQECASSSVSVMFRKRFCFCWLALFYVCFLFHHALSCLQLWLYPYEVAWEDANPHPTPGNISTKSPVAYFLISTSLTGVIQSSCLPLGNKSCESVWLDWMLKAQ